MAASWDVFRTEAGDVLKGLSADAVRAALAGGVLSADDMARPAGSKQPWTPIAALTELTASPASKPEPAPVPPPGPIQAGADDAGSAEILAVAEDDAIEVHVLEPASPADSAVALPVAEDDAVEVKGRDPGPAAAGAIPEAVLIDPEELARIRAREPQRRFSMAGAADPLEMPGGDLSDGHDPLAEDAEATSFTLAQRGHEEMEEMDLAAMVDIAMQLVMFFLVTSAVVFFKSVEIPPPDPDKAQATAARQAPRDLKELEESNILVEIDARGQIQVDHEPIRPEALVPKLRAARESNGRTAMLLMADLTTPHRNAVLAYDAASEIGLSIKIGKPAGGGG